MLSKKLSTLILSLLPIYSHASISHDAMDLPLIEKYSDQKTEYAVSLSALKANVLYNLSCKVSNPEGRDTKIMVEPHLLASSTYSNVKLNNQPMESNTGTLQPGANQVTFSVLVGKGDAEHYNSFYLSNLSDTSLQVAQCTATESTPKINAQNASASSMSDSDRGYFYVTNETSKTVSIAVGNYFPTPYTIGPNTWKTIWVSSCNQDMYIKKID